MPLKDQLQKLAQETNSPCVTISLNTHRTHPANAQDEIMLKNSLKEAEERILNEYDKRSVKPLLDKMEKLASEVDANLNLDSLHIFLSNDTQEILKSSWSTSNEGVHISDRFALRSLIKTYNRSENYLIMLLSQGGVHLYEALNDGIIKEIRNGEFPFAESKHSASYSDKVSDSEFLHDQIRDYLNRVDKALVRVHESTDLDCVVICTEDMYSRLLQEADKPSLYLGHTSINYGVIGHNQLGTHAWEILKEQQHERRAKAIEEMHEAVSQGKVVTDLQEIYQAAIDGRADLLIVHQSFAQPVIMKNERTFDLIDDHTAPDAIDDITSNIAWEVLSKKGRVFFTGQEEIQDLGNIVLKTRY